MIQVATIAKGVELGRRASPDDGASRLLHIDSPPPFTEAIPMATRQQITEHVEQILTNNFRDVEMYAAEGFTLRQGSARAFIEIEATDDSLAHAPAFVRITVPLLQQVTETQELHRHIAFNAGSNRYGSLALRSDSEHGTCIYFMHTLLGNYLDDDELGYAVSEMLAAADDLDDELQQKFGGKRFHED